VNPRLTFLSVALAGALVFAACGNDDDDEPAQTVEPTPATEQAEETMAAPEQARADIVETAQAAGDFTTLTAAVEAAGLTEILRGDGPFTVFAPTDAAFEEALSALGMTAEQLLADEELLTAILTYHVVEGEVPAADVVGLDGQSVPTVNGAQVAIAIEGETVMVNDATVVTPDVFASNGVIHVIDSVLLPPS
jgi:uncharacterized surface protein with fasciclin (FAS1) repeats